MNKYPYLLTLLVILCSGLGALSCDEGGGLDEPDTDNDDCDDDDAGDDDAGDDDAGDDDAGDDDAGASGGFPDWGWFDVNGALVSEQQSLTYFDGLGYQWWVSSETGELTANDLYIIYELEGCDGEAYVPATSPRQVVHVLVDDTWATRGDHQTSEFVCGLSYDAGLGCLDVEICYQAVIYDDCITGIDKPDVSWPAPLRRQPL